MIPQKHQIQAIEPDNQRYLKVPLLDKEPVRGGLLPGEEDVAVRDYYKYELAEKYGLTVPYFNEYYLHAPDILPRLEALGYNKKKTRLLSRGMIRVIFEIHGKP